MKISWTTVLVILVHAIYGFSSRTVSYSVHVKEDAKQGFVVLDVASLLHIGDKRTRRFKTISQVLILSRDSQNKLTSESLHVDWLVMNERTGIITLSRPFDRDVQCPGVSECVIRAEVVVLPQGVFQLVELDVIVDDVNDNAPVFPTDLVEIELPENKPVKEVISLDSYMAVDIDSGRNAEIKYTLSRNDFIGLKHFVGESETPHLQLFLKQELDYETVPKLNLVILAKDNGENPLTSRLRLKITVMDVNDNHPVFEKEKYHVLLNENSESGAVIATVRATDADHGVFGRVRYSISDRNSLAAKKLVTIGEKNGEVTLRVRADHAVHDQLRIFVEAEDADPYNKKTGGTWLYINVKDVNDNAPSVRVNFILSSEKNKVFVPESAPIGTYIGRISTTDKDKGDNGEVDVRLSTMYPVCNHQHNPTDSSKTFGLTKNGFIESLSLFDREACAEYRIKILAMDRGNPPRSSTAIVEVVILDVNEFAPECDPPSQSVRVPEDANVGTLVAAVSAVDGDDATGPVFTTDEGGKVIRSENGEVIFELENGSNGPFVIDQHSGEIRLCETLDRETTSIWKLVISARDGGVRPRKNTCEVIVHVGDVNDNPPRFTTPVFNNSVVYANTLKNEVILRIQAEDPDAELNGRIKYQLISDEKYAGTATNRPDSAPQYSLQTTKMHEKLLYFTLHPLTGDLRLNFSRAEILAGVGMHRLIVKAEDFGNPARAAFLAIRVNVAKHTNMNANIVETRREDTVTQSGDLLALAISLGSAFVLLTVVIVIVSVKCRRMNRQDEHDQKDADPPVDGSEEHGVLGDTAMEGCRVRCSGVVTDTEKENDSENIPNQDVMVQSSSPSDCCQMHDEVSEAEPPSVLQRLEVASLAHSDGDSGRGDSDIDVTYPKLADYKVYRQSRELETSCDEMCEIYSHGDVCWVPNEGNGTSANSKETHVRRTSLQESVNHERDQLKPRYFWHPEERIQRRQRLSCALPVASSVRALRSHNRFSSEPHPIVHPIEKLHSDPYLSEEMYAAGLSKVARQNKRFYEPPLASRASWSTNCEFKSVKSLPRYGSIVQNSPRRASECRDFVDYTENVFLDSPSTSNQNDLDDVDHMHVACDVIPPQHTNPGGMAAVKAGEINYETDSLLV